MFQCFMLGALVLLVLLGLFRVQVVGFLESIGWLARCQDDKNEGEEEEEEEETAAVLRGGSSRDAAPLDVAAEMGSAMTGTSLQPSFVDPSRGAVRAAAAARRSSEAASVPPPRDSGGNGDGAAWSASAAWSSLFGGGGAFHPTAATTSRQIGLTNSGRDGVQAPAAPRIEFTTFQPAAAAAVGEEEEQEKNA